MNPIPNDQVPHFAGFIGLDWGNKTHAYHLVSADASNPASAKFPNTPEALHTWCLDLQSRWPNQNVALAVESGCPGLLGFLAQFPWLTVFTVHSATSRRFRQALIPSGAKDDLPDAAILLDLLRHHRDRLRPVLNPDPALQALESRCKARRQWVDQRTRFTNQLASLLARFYPVAVELCGGVLHSPMALAFLTRWPDPLRLRSAKSSALKSFFHHHHVRDPELIAKRIERAHSARFLVTDETIIQVAREELAALVNLLTPLCSTIELLDAAIAKEFKAHPDAPFFASLPGAGKNLAPRLLVLFGSCRDRWSGADQLQRFAGIAPVTERSGASVWIHRRWQNRRFDHQTLVEWARCSVASSAWAEAYLKQQLARGCRPFAVYRSLAFKWLRIVWACWKQNTPYDEPRYLESLRRRGSRLVLETQASDATRKPRASSPKKAKKP